MKPAASRSEGSFVICSYNSMAAMFDHVATWTNQSGLAVFGDVIFPDFSRNFKRKKLRLGIWESLPFTRRLSNNGTVKYGGFCMVLLEEMARVLNFTYELVEPSDGQYGSPEENGTWNGMVGMLVRGEIDMAVGPFSITPERKRVIDFSVPFMEDGGGILTKGGDPDPDLLNVFRPFHPHVWLLTSVAIVVTTVVFFVVNRVSRILPGPGLWKAGGGGGGRPERIWTLEECLLTIYGSLMNQGASRHPVRGCGRVVLGCWWLFTILMVSVYTASLAALLTVRLQAHNVNSLQELASSSDLHPLTIVGSSWWTLFTNAQKGVYAMIGQRLREGPVVRVNEDALELVHKGTGAYLMDVNQIRYLYSQDCHRLHMAHTVFNSNGLGFALPQNAIFREAVNNVILKLHEGGFLEAWKRKWWTSSPDCDHDRPHVTPTTRLPLLSLGGILILYGCVVLLSVLCLLFQLCWQAAAGCRSHLLWRRSFGNGGGADAGVGAGGSGERHTAAAAT
ncbi:glutamate receptor ionotropic, kainate 5-like [Babylonia areolata]|uniref:glutamate receptor ionotropic, kainate 5-like n=1 Tax=Babylonia areolata TaxID=304850 RepID=UPI003FD272F5